MLATPASNSMVLPHQLTVNLDWNIESLKRHIETIHVNAALSDDAVELLWRSFYYYAHYPFPNTAAGGKVDWDAFQRAVSLLAVQSTDILGMQDEELHFWRADHDDVLFQKANFARVIRSIGVPSPTGESFSQTKDNSSDLINDTMDVLAMTQPYTIKLAPSPDQLQSAAQKLLQEACTPRQYHVKCEDLSVLLSLLLRLRLERAKWHWKSHYGRFETATSNVNKLPDILINGLGGDQEENSLSPYQIEKIMDLLVSVVGSRGFSMSDLCSQICNSDSTNSGPYCFNQWSADD